MAFLHYLTEPSWDQCLFLLSATFKYFKRLNAVLFLLVCHLLLCFTQIQSFFHLLFAAPCPAGDPVRKGSHDATCTSLVTHVKLKPFKLTPYPFLAYDRYDKGRLIRRKTILKIVSNLSASLGRVFPGNRGAFVN